MDALVRQRVYGLALGYEDLNDHEALRHDPLLAAAVGSEVLAGKSTLNRLELSTPESAAAGTQPVSRLRDGDDRACDDSSPAHDEDAGASRLEHRFGP